MTLKARIRGLLKREAPPAPVPVADPIKPDDPVKQRAKPTDKQRKPTGNK